MKKSILFVEMLPKVALAMVIAIGVLTGCSTVNRVNRHYEEGGDYQDILVPNKDFQSLGLVVAEYTREGDGEGGEKGEVYTYYKLLQEAQKLGADAIVNVKIEGNYSDHTDYKLGKLIKKDAPTSKTWYGSATAIKYTETIKTDVDTHEVVVMGGVPVDEDAKGWGGIGDAIGDAIGGGADSVPSAMPRVDDDTLPVPNNWIAGNVGSLGGGVQYERVILPKLSVGADVYYYTYFLFNTFGVEANVRYYPFSGRWLQGLYGNVGLGFGIYTGDFGDESYWSSIAGFLLRPGIGWKLDVGKPGGFFVEPNVSVPLIIGEDFGVNYVGRVALGYAW